MHRRAHAEFAAHLDEDWRQEAFSLIHQGVCSARIQH